MLFLAIFCYSFVHLSAKFVLVACILSTVITSKLLLMFPWAVLGLYKCTYVYLFFLSALVICVLSM